MLLINAGGDMTTQTCETCRYWQDLRQATIPSDRGLCHRYPASVATEPDHWCGDRVALEPLEVAPSFPIEDTAEINRVIRDQQRWRDRMLADLSRALAWPMP